MATTNTAYRPYPPGTVNFSFCPNQMAQLSRSNKNLKKITRAIRKIRNSHATPAEKDELIRQVYQKEGISDGDPYLSREILTPKPQSRKHSNIIGPSQSYTAPFSQINWPEVHAEMEMRELNTARTALMTMLNELICEKVNLFEEADAACIALWNATTALRRLICYYEDKQDTALTKLYLSATRDMEAAVERLTCEMLDRSNVQVFQRAVGSLPLRLQRDQGWRLIADRIRISIDKADRMLMAGKMLLIAFGEGEWQFMRGILETLSVLSTTNKISGKSSGKANRISYVREVCLMSKENFMEHKRDRRYNHPHMNGRRSANTNSYSVLADDGNNLEKSSSYKGKGVLRDTFQSSVVGASSTCTLTGANACLISSTTPKGIKRVRERANENYRDTSPQDSDSSTDEDELGGIKRPNSSKRSKPNLDTYLLSEPSQLPQSQETSIMKKFRMEVEGVSICDDSMDREIGGEHDEANVGVKDEMGGGTVVEEIL